MYENIAWNNFCKTGDLESFLEYKKIVEIYKNINENESENVSSSTGESLVINDFNVLEGKGDVFSELDKSKGSSN